MYQRTYRFSQFHLSWRSFSIFFRVSFPNKDGLEINTTNATNCASNSHEKQDKKNSATSTTLMGKTGKNALHVHFEKYQQGRKGIRHLPMDCSGPEYKNEIEKRHLSMFLQWCRCLQLWTILLDMQNSHSHNVGGCGRRNELLHSKY